MAGIVGIQVKADPEAPFAVDGQIDDGGIAVGASLPHALGRCAATLVELSMQGVVVPLCGGWKTLPALRRLTLCSYGERSRLLVRQAPALRHLHIEFLTGSAVASLRADAAGLAALETLDVSDPVGGLREAILALAEVIPAVRRGHSWLHRE